VWAFLEVTTFLEIVDPKERSLCSSSAFGGRRASLRFMEIEMKNLFLSAAAIAIAALTAVPAQAASTLPPDVVRNIVLVHGAFVDETSWDRVAAILTARGFHVTEVKNPLTSLADDVAATNAVLATQDGPTVLVGHSWGGVVIGEAGDTPNVTALVYVSAFAPDKGETLTKLSANGPPTPGVKAIRPDSRGYLSIDKAAFPSVVAADLPKREAALLADRQMALNHTAFDALAQVAAWHDKPSFYVVSADDKLLDPNAQRFFAKRMNATVTMVDGSHASLISHAKTVAAVIEAAAGLK
jgi:pimeloyl-ACP methyl ester carboxylesterase